MMTAEELKSARAKLKMTQADMAFALGVDTATVGKWEIGMYPIDQRTALAVEHLGCKRKARLKRQRVISTS